MGIMKCKLDWLSFTWKSGDTFNENEFDEFLKVFPEIEKVLSWHSIVKDRKGGKGSFYDTVLNFADFFAVSFCRERLNGEHQGDVNMGVNVSVPAHGLECFFNLLGFTFNDSIKVFRLLVDRNCKFSRLDFAYDDYDKVYEPMDYQYWFINIARHKKYSCGGQMMVTNCKSSKMVGKGQVEGMTFYLGSRENGKLMRVYDKAYESEGRINAIRYEFELHSKYTAAAVNYILQENAYPTFEEFIHQFIIRIVDVGENQIKCQGSEVNEWSDFVNASNPPLTQRLELKATRPEECSIKTVKQFRWYLRSSLLDLCAYRSLFGEERFNKLLDTLDQDKVLRHLDVLKRDYNNNQRAIDRIFFKENGNVNPDWTENLKAI